MRDRRMRQLHLTEKGTALESTLWAAQRPRLVRVPRGRAKAVVGFRRVMMGLIDERTKAGTP